MTNPRHQEIKHRVHVAADVVCDRLTLRAVRDTAAWRLRWVVSVTATMPIWEAVQHRGRLE